MKAEIIDINSLRSAIYDERYGLFDPQLGLELVTIEGDLDGVRFMVEERGADPRQSQCYPFYIAVSHDHFHIVQYFLEKFPIDVNADDGELLCVATEQGSEAMVSFLIDEIGCDVNVDDGRPLLWAVQGGLLSNLRLLIERYGVDDSSLLRKVLTLAVVDDHFQIVRYLVEKAGVRPGIDDCLAVWLAWHCGHPRIVAYLSRCLLQGR